MRIFFSTQLIKVTTVVSFIILWQIISTLNIYNPYLFPSPIKVLSAFWEMLKSGDWQNDLLASLLRYFTGFFIGTILGILTGIVTGRIIIFKLILNPLFTFLRSIPTIALVPLFIVWLGIGDIEKFTLVAWGVFFPVWLNTYLGISNVESEYIWAAKSLGCKGINLISSVYIPRAFLFINSGIRIAIATGFFALAAAEMASSFSGVAFKIFQAHQLFRTDIMIVYIITIGSLSLLFDIIYIKIIKYLFPWQNLIVND